MNGLLSKIALLFSFIFALLADLPYLLRPAYVKVAPNLVRTKACMDPLDKNVYLEYPKLPDVMYQKPFVKDFTDMMMFLKGIDVEAMNSFSVAKPRKNDGIWESLFYDPFAGYKDCWFGCYFVFDDPEGKGRNFMLLDTSENVENVENINELSMCMLTEIDQKLVYYSSHNGDASYTIDKCHSEFYFDLVSEPVVSFVTRKKGDRWKKVVASATTIAAMPDNTESTMGLVSSIRSYCGLPAPKEYDFLSPWHEITVHGELYSTYIENGDRSFWAIVFFNGSEYTLSDGRLINTWSDGKLRDQFRNAFEDLVVKGVP